METNEQTWEYGPLINMAMDYTDDRPGVGGEAFVWKWQAIDYRKRNWILQALDKAKELGDLQVVLLLEKQLKSVDSCGDYKYVYTHGTSGTDEVLLEHKGEVS